MVHIQLGEYDLAVEYLEKAIKINPIADYYFYLATAYIMKNDLAMVCKKLNKGKERFDSDYYRSNPYFEMPGQVYKSDFIELIKKYCE